MRCSRSNSSSESGAWRARNAGCGFGTAFRLSADAMPSFQSLVAILPREIRSGAPELGKSSAGERNGADDGRRSELIPADRNSRIADACAVHRLGHRRIVLEEPDTLSMVVSHQYQ
jgi:hypothetical protein